MQDVCILAKSLSGMQETLEQMRENCCSKFQVLSLFCVTRENGGDTRMLVDDHCLFTFKQLSLRLRNCPNSVRATLTTFTELFYYS